MVVGEGGGRVQCMEEKEEEEEEEGRRGGGPAGGEQGADHGTEGGPGQGQLLPLPPCGVRGGEGLEVGQVIPLICGLARLVGAVVLEQGLLIATQKEQLLWLP